MEVQSAPSDEIIPAGFRRMRPFGGFHELVGPLYEARRGERTVVGMRVTGKHLNAGGNIHGGMYLTLLDTAMTQACIRLRRPDVFPATTSMSSEFLAPARLGDWIDAEVEVLRAGQRTVILNCIARRGGCNGEALIRGSATFQLLRRPSTSVSGDG